MNSPSQRATRVRLIVLAFACGLSLITYLDRVCISQVGEYMQPELHLTDVEMGFVFSAFVLGYALFEVPGGYLGERYGTRRVLSCIVLWWSLWTALTGCIPFFPLGYGLRIGPVMLLFDTLVLLLLIRFIFGAGEAGAYPNLTIVVSTWFPYRERAMAQGAIWMCARLGGAIAPVLIEWLSHVIGWRLAFSVLGLIGISWCVCFFWWFRDRPEDMPQCNQEERDWIRTGGMPLPPPEAGSGDGTKEKGHAWPPMSVLASSLSLWALCVAACGVSFGWWFYPTWQPRYLRDVHGIHGTKNALAASLPYLCGAFGAFLGGSLSDWLVRRLGSKRWGRSLVGIFGFTGAGVCVLATGFAPSREVAVLLLCLAFFINDLAIPPLWAASADIGGRYAGTVAGVMNMAGGLGAFLSPILIPVVLGALPADLHAVERWRWIFIGLSAAWFLGVVAWFFVDAGKPLFKESGH